jgi:hypothetical protein
VHYTKFVLGWSTYINGMQVNDDEFKAQVARAVEHVKDGARDGWTGNGPGSSG